MSSAESLSVLTVVAPRDDARAALAHLDECLAIAARMGCPLDLLVAADPATDGREALLRSASAGGARRAWQFDNPSADAASEADVIVAAIEQLQAVEAAAIDGSTLILLAADGGEEIASRLAHRTGGVPLGVCASTFAHDADGLAANRVSYGGEIAAEVVASAGPWFACVRASSSAPRPEGGGGATIELVSLPRSDLIAASLEMTSEPALADAADIGNAALIVAGGRGVGEAGFEAIRTLAENLGGAWAGSLPTVDAGWVPVSRQVGQSGRHVEPEVYLAIGISGTLQHFAGVGERARIVAINKDAEADIFKFADLGIVAPWEDVMPSLIRLAGSEDRTGS